METILTVSHKVLESLDATAAVRHFRNLLWCEARRSGLPSHKVVVSLDTNVSDGGIDAKIEDIPNTESLLINGNSYFQIKTGKSFKPWQSSSLKKELIGKARTKPTKELLGKTVKACLDTNGRYVLVTFGYDLTPLQHSSTRQNLEELFRTCGYSNPTVEVIGQGQLVGLFSSYPSLCIELLDRVDFTFQTVDGWKTNEDMTSSLQLADSQKAFVKDIRSAARGTEFQHIRVIGEPGIGKTRLVLEALSQDDLSFATIYVPLAEDFQKSQLFNDLLRPDRRYYAQLVIDDCAENDRASIWHAIKGKPNIKLITVDHGPETSSDSSMKVIECPILPDEQIGTIIAGYIGNRGDVSNWAKWCSGSPRVAHAVGDNLQRNPNDILKSPATVPIWDRFILGHKTRETKEAEQHLLVLRHLALFQRFGFEAPVDNEARFISSLVKEADPAITWAKFQSIVRHHKGRRILQGKRTLFIVPKALHVYLWLGYWEHYGRGFSFQSFFSQVPSDLRKWFLELFIYAHAAPVARQIVKQILSPTNGPFSNQAFLESESGTRFLNYLAEADPSATLALLEATYGKWSIDKLRTWDIGRQNIVWALEKIAVWNDTFSHAARLLVRMALAENAKNSNNSKGTLLSLFMIGVGWAPTEALPEQRFPVIEELLRSHDSAMRELGLELCEQWLSTYGGMRIIGAEYQGMRPTVEFWRPKTYGEIYNCWRKVWDFLWQETRGWDETGRRKAHSTIIKAASGLLCVPVLSEKIMTTLFDVTKDPATDKAELVQFIIRELKFRVEKLPKGIVSSLHELDRLLTGESYWDRFSRYVLLTNWDEDYAYKEEQVIKSTAPKKRVLELVQEIVKKPELLQELLPRFVISNGHRLYQFGQELALAANDRSYDRQVMAAHEAGLPTVITQFSGGYFAGVRQLDRAAWEEIVLSFLASDTLRAIGVEVIYLSGISKRIIHELMQLYNSGKVSSTAFGRLGLFADEENVQQRSIEDVLTLLVDRPDGKSTPLLAEITDRYFINGKIKRKCSEQLLYRLLTSHGFFEKDSDTMLGYHWNNIAKMFMEQYPARHLELFSVILANMHNLSGLRQMSYPIQIADAIAQTHPANAWELVTAHIEHDNENGYYILNWLSDEISFDDEHKGNAIYYFDPTVVMAWVAEKPEKRIRLIRHCLPKTLDISEGGALTHLFIDRYGKNEDTAHDLIFHFWTGGWSGPESVYLMRKRDKARKWVSEISSDNIQAWLSMYIDYLTKRIVAAEIEEERRF